MGSTTEQVANADDRTDDSAEEEGARPRVDASPDDLDASVTGDRDHVRTIICETLEFASSPFCDPDPP